MAVIDKSSAVSVRACDSYDIPKIKENLLSQFSDLGIDKAFFEGKKVVIKPNLVMKKAPEFAATTHPAFLHALLLILKDFSCEIIVAESPGGLYTPQSLLSTYKGCGLFSVCQELNVDLNTDVSCDKMSAKNGKICRSFNIIKPIFDADVIINLSKLKTHSLTKMSAAVKNMFGSIPGIEKFEMHARFPDQNDFVKMITDLTQTLCEEKEMIAIVDAVVGMQGNGPTGGTPKNIGCMLASRNPFCADVVCEHILNMDNTVLMVNEAKSRNLCPEKYESVNIIGEDPDIFLQTDLILPDSQKSKRGASFLSKLPHLFGGRLNEYLAPKPKIIKSKCVRCGECVRSCPQKTISFDKKGKIHFDYKNCIRCYCCQELCPKTAIKIKQNFIIKIIT